ncbi:MAG: DUF547 domain-containing protein [Planctomycetota bacterium]|jgi:hypothetical protein
MAKRLVLLVTFAVPVFVCCCSAIEADRIEPAVEEKTTFQPAEVEADRMVPGGVEPDEVEPAHAEPGQSEPAGLEQSGHEPNDVLTVASAPNEPEPNEVEPAWSEPNSVRLDQATSFHAKCAEILKEFVDDKGMVDYKGLRRKRLELRALLNEFNDLDPNEYKSWPKEDKIAFWINAYNLQKLKVVTDNYPIEPSSRILTIYWGPSSIRHIEQKVSRHKFLVMDEEFTFASVEKRFFSGEFDDPRIFFALSNACLSSPPLRNEPYTGDRLDEQLDRQTRKFLAPSSPRGARLGFRIDRKRQKVYLSALFQLSSYGKEFAEKFAIDRKFKDHPPAARAVLNFVSNYISRQDVSFLEVGNYTIEYMSYDWTINDGS